MSLKQPETKDVVVTGMSIVLVVELLVEGTLPVVDVEVVILV